MEAELINPGDDTQAFKSLVLGEMKELIRAAYGNEMGPNYIKDMGYCLIIKENDKVIAGCLIDFESYPAPHFYTRLEAVLPERQRTGIGRLLFSCVEHATNFLTNYELFIYAELSMNAGNDSGYHIVATIDREPEMNEDNSSGHGTFLKKVGYEHSMYDWECGEDCVEFCRFVAY